MTKSKPGIKSDLKKVDAHIIQPHEYEDAPELTDEQLGSVEVSVGIRPRGRPKAQITKVPVSLRLDADVLEAFKATGVGWQTQINAALKTVVRMGIERHQASGAMVRNTRGDKPSSIHVRSAGRKLNPKRPQGPSKPKRA